MQSTSKPENPQCITILILQLVCEELEVYDLERIIPKLQRVVKAADTYPQLENVSLPCVA